MPIYQKPNTSRPNKAHKIYPYLLGDMHSTKANHVWCADITYIPMRKGFLYLVAIMDWLVGGFCRGDCPTHWRQTSVWKHWTKPYLNLAPRRYLTPIRVASLRDLSGLIHSAKQRSKPLWTAKVVSWTTYLLSGFGDH